jgi:hypothetical protein
MSRVIERWCTGRWALSILILLLVLGHACELPAYAEVVGLSHVAGESHHAGDGHHGDEPVLSCDGSAATSSPGHPAVAAVPDMSVVSEVGDPAPMRVVAGSCKDAKVAARPPLFLLHASLLI